MRVRLVHRQHHVTAEGDVLVCDIEHAVVHTVRGAHAAALRAVIDQHDGAMHAAALPDDAVTQQLIAAGLLARCTPDTDHDGHPLEARHDHQFLPRVTTAAATTGTVSGTASGTVPARVDRRRFLGTGLGISATVAAGITTLVLPTAAHAASGALPPASPTTTTVALPAEPNTSPTVSRSAVTRNIRVTWDSTPEPFTYQWIVYSNDGELVQRGTGTANSASLPVVIFTMPAGVVKFRVTTTSNTSPSATHTTNLTF